MSNSTSKAFPASVSINSVGDITSSEYVGEGGLTKRELFAAMAMQGYLGTFERVDKRPAAVSKWAVKQADALLAALEGGE